MLKLGITSRITESSNYIEKRDALSHDWPKFLEKNNAIPISIPNSLSDTENFLKEINLDGIILSGGDNIGDTPERDKTEKILINFAINVKIPIFGICRGMQVLNNYFGGNNMALNNSTHIDNDHIIKIENNIFSELLQSSELVVNSFHHNVITKESLGKSLIPFALSKNDKTVEGFFHSELPIIGVMWHPEREQKIFDEKIFHKIFKTN
jgi:putative glutamine amidotransferase